MRIKLLLFFIFLSSTLWAQEEKDVRQVYLQAEEEYNIGHFDTSILLLSKNLNLFTGTLKASACRLMALCYLEQDNTAEAEKNVAMLLKIDPYYSVSIHDPLRFVDMVEQLKKGGATITTASQQAETLDEAPVPVTLITQEMIAASGARNLSDLLLLYVPGMSLIESDEANIAMHGVYSRSQEKILIMLDGHRLNSRATNSEAPDYRNSLDKIKQIEVLRGPASSLYGNVALTAVVNIITKKGNDVDGVKASLGYGNNETYRGDFIFGKSGLGIDFMAWASIYSSKGEKRYIGVNDKDFYGKVLLPGSMYIGGYNHKPAYDLGFTCSWNNLKLLFNTQYSKKVSSYNQVYFSSLYDYDRYRSIEGVTPGHSRQSTHLDLSYEKVWEKSSLKFSIFADFDHANYYDVDGDSILEEDADYPLPDGEYFQGTIQTNKGAFQSLSWNDYSYGLNTQYSTEYRIKGQKGFLLIGTQMENYVMKDNMFLMGDQFDRIIITFSDKNSKIIKENEINLSFFSQLKHYLNERLIFNGGVRYDYKKRYNNKQMNVFSPRISLNYLIQNGMSLKLGYSHSFVDAPFFYRANKMNAYKGAENLEAEGMDALQFSFAHEIHNPNIRYEINAYYNRLSNMIYNNTSAWSYLNSGKVNLMGLEGTFSYKSKKMMTHLTCSYQHVLNMENYTGTNRHIHHVPDFIMHLITTYKILEHKRIGNIDIRGNLEWLSKQQAPIIGVNNYKGNNIYYNPDKTEKARVILNLGLTYALKKVTIALDTYNLLHTNYYQGGATQTNNPQQGFSWVTKISYKF